MRKIIIALLLAIAVTLTACADDTQTEETTSDAAAPETEQTEQTESAQASSPAPSYSPSRPTCDFSPYWAVPADTKIEYEFTEEDEELHEILEGLDQAWSIFTSINNGPDEYVNYDKLITVIIPQVEADYELQYVELSDELPFSNTEEFKAELYKCFTENCAYYYICDFDLAKAEIVSENDGVYTLEITDYAFMPINDDGEVVYVQPEILEFNDRLYRYADGFATRLKGIDYSTTRVLSRTEEELEFAFIFPVPYEEYILTAKETLKFEDGGWKYDRFLTYPEKANELDFQKVWGGSYEDQVTVIGEYDSADLAEFDYSADLESIETDFMDGNVLSQYRELYRKTYALAFTLRDGYSLPESVDGLAKIQVTDGYSKETLEYYFSGISSDSFNRRVTEVFVPEEVDRLLYKYRTFYEYDGVLWVREAEADDSVCVHTEYEWIKDAEWMMIGFKRYYVGADKEPVFDPELEGAYDLQQTRFSFILTDGGWLADGFLD